jgi:hypothetical protein
MICLVCIGKLTMVKLVRILYMNSIFPSLPHFLLKNLVIINYRYTICIS